MNLIAFDLSMSNSGFCVFSSNDTSPKLLVAGSIDTSKDNEHRGKLKHIGRILTALKNKYKPDIVIMEGGFSRFNQSTQVIFRVHGVCNYIFYDVPQIYYAPMSVKKIVGGRGNMTKDELHIFLLKKFPKVEFANYDESDAFAIGLCYFIKEGIIRKWEV